jgi:hypothetical protein
MRDKPSFAGRLGKFLILICVIGLLAVSLILIYQLSNRSTGQPSSNGGPTTGIAYPSSTNLCVNGCQAHENWIEFYLPSNSYYKNSLRLKTSLFLGQILTFGISSAPCQQQERAGYTCLVMEISHRLLTVLTSLNLTPLSQLRVTNNWWLEYTQKQ